jgi:hypothetical protein
VDYFRRQHPLRKWRFRISLGLFALSAVWLAWYLVAGNRRTYSSGPISPAHAVFGANCSACHLQQAGLFHSAAADSACLSCHDGPIHHMNQSFTPTCSSCHVEHRGPARLAATAELACTRCHASLVTRGTVTKYDRSIDSFESHHPEFAPLRPGSSDPGAIKLNHFVHMKQNLRGPNGAVQMDCSDCHRTAADTRTLRFGSAAAQPQPTAIAGVALPSERRRAYMAPPAYAQHCLSCHPLTFDNRFADSVPHDKPQVVHEFVVKEFQRYIAVHPSDLRVSSPAGSSLPERPMPAGLRVLTPAQWVNERVAEAELLLWNKTCKECHTLNLPSGSLLPEVAASNITKQWLPHAVFDHNQHRMVTCASCHAGALTSQETSDVLLPGIRTCRQCHHPGAEAAESRCFECHAYHDWSQQKEVKGGFNFPELLGKPTQDDTRLSQQGLK